MRSKIVATTIAVLAVAAQASALDTGTSREMQLAQARANKSRVASEASATKGTPQALLRFEEQRLQRLIDDLEQGRSVDPDALKPRR